EGRGYVLRRIIRRAVRHGNKLGMPTPFFYRLVQPLVDEMGAAYPELARVQQQVEQALEREERRFAETLELGMKILEDSIASLSGQVIDGETVFRLYDTYGFPVDLTADIARERGLKLDEAGFERAMDAQRERARAAGKFGVDMSGRIEVDQPTVFHGYELLQENSRVLGLYRGGQPVKALQAGDEGQVVLDQTPFYAESGGQIGDTGVLQAGTGIFRVSDTRKQGGAFVHLGKVEQGELTVGDPIEARVDSARRQAIVLNHSATHLMHAALRQVLGTHVEQKGSLVTDERLRFDFSHPEPVTAEQMAEIEAIVNAEILANAAAQARIMSMDAALEAGAMALFGEKYGDEVRVMQIGFSTELCGGCHVHRTGDIGLFKIVSEGGVAAGIRRIEAVTGMNALAWVHDTSARLADVARLVRSGSSDVVEKTRSLLQKNRELEKQLEQLKSRLSAQAGASLVDQAEEVAGVRLLVANLEGADPKGLRDTLDQLKSRLGRAVVVLSTVSDGRISLVAGVTRGETARFKAGEVLKHVAEQVGGKGGGRPDMAQGGGTDVAALPAALASVKAWMKTRVQEK
ncbi:MAG TPA: alanine--tRNA ligase, partial [Thiolinea sp.]|nr:alanine--tRNA ligase [Thiolinea sp.]